jgi:protein SCO1/2
VTVTEQGAGELVDVPRSPRWPRVLRAAVLAVVIVAGGAAIWVVAQPSAPLPGLVRTPAVSVAGLEFVDYDDGDAGVPADLVPAAGEVTLAYFGYMSCPDVCPTTLADIRVALQEVGPDRAADVTVAFVTVDPERDDPARMRDYLQLFYPDLPNQTAALRADGPTSLDEATSRLSAYYEVAEHEPGAERYDVGHSAVTYVIDDTGDVVRELPFGTSSQDFARVIEHVLATRA